MTTKINGTFLVRSGTQEQWNNATKSGEGANRVLRKGEIGWIVSTSYFKIGDGVHPWKELDFITPPSSGAIEYALKLGDDGGYYTYDSIKEILDNLPDYDSMIIEINAMKEDIADLKANKNIYVNTFSDLPGIGVQGPLYICKDNGDVYFFNIDQIEGKYMGYIKINNPDIIQAKIDSNM